MVQNITVKEFNDAVLKSNVPVIVDVFADWCGPCKRIAPELETLETRVREKVKIVKIDCDLLFEEHSEASEILKKAGAVRQIPALVIFQNGKAMPNISRGYCDAKDIQAWAERNLGYSLIEASPRPS